MQTAVAKAVKDAFKNTLKEQGHATQAHERRKAPEPFAPPANQAHKHGRSLSPAYTSMFELFTQQEEKNSKVSLFHAAVISAPTGTRCVGQAESRDAERVRAMHSRRCAWSRWMRTLRSAPLQAGLHRACRQRTPSLPQPVPQRAGSQQRGNSFSA